MPEKPFGVDLDDAKVNALDVVSQRRAHNLAERARLISERKEIEKLLPYCNDQNLLDWFAKQRAEALENMVKAATDSGRLFCQAAVRTIDILVVEIKKARELYNQWSDLIDRLS